MRNSYKWHCWNYWGTDFGLNIRWYFGCGDGILTDESAKAFKDAMWCWPFLFQIVQKTYKWIKYWKIWFRCWYFCTIHIFSVFIFFHVKLGWSEGKEYQSSYFWPYGLSFTFSKRYLTKANTSKCEKAHFKWQIYSYICWWSFYFIKDFWQTMSEEKQARAVVRKLFKGLNSKCFRLCGSYNLWSLPTKILFQCETRRAILCWPNLRHVFVI